MLLVYVALSWQLGNSATCLFVFGPKDIIFLKQ